MLLGKDRRLLQFIAFHIAKAGLNSTRQTQVELLGQRRARGVIVGKAKSPTQLKSNEVLKWFSDTRGIWWTVLRVQLVIGLKQWSASYEELTEFHFSRYSIYCSILKF